MSKWVDEPVPLNGVGRELLISGRALADLLRAVSERDMPFRFCAKGQSMFPFVRDGDIITAVPLRATPPSLGSVVAFVQDPTGRLAVHRVVGKRSGLILIRGDCAPSMDEPVSEAQVLGRVTRVERRGRSVWFGNGPERTAVALLTRYGIVPRILAPAWRRLRPILRSWGQSLST